MVDRDGERTSLSRDYERSSELNVDQITNEVNINFKSILDLRFRLFRYA
jgi:hypothetical protein